MCRHVGISLDRAQIAQTVMVAISASVQKCGASDNCRDHCCREAPARRPLDQRVLHRHPGSLAWRPHPGQERTVHNLKLLSCGGWDIGKSRLPRLKRQPGLHHDGASRDLVRPESPLTKRILDALAL